MAKDCGFPWAVADPGSSTGGGLDAGTLGVLELRTSLVPPLRGTLVSRVGGDRWDRSVCDREAGLVLPLDGADG